MLHRAGLVACRRRPLSSNVRRQMTWAFTFTERSAGSYECVGRRDSGHRVSAQVGEGELSRVIQYAFELECDLGTDPSRALFVVARGAKPDWEATYYDHAFGSWHVQATPASSGRIIYDGKDSWLSLYRADERPAWEGPFKRRDDIPEAVFGFLSPDAA